LTDEYIMVLNKGGRSQEAINIYVQLEQYQKAQQFGEMHNQLTELLTTYF